MKSPHLYLSFILAVICSSGGIASAQTAAEGHTVVRPQIRRAPLWLGLALKQEREPAAVKVTGLLRRSPSDGSGVQVGDEIVKVGDTPVSTMRSIRKVVNAYENNDVVKVTVSRGAKEVVLDFKLAPMPDSEAMIRNHLIGFEAPPLDFQYVGDGKHTSLESLRGKPTIIDFWATWCGPCHTVQDGLAKIKNRFGDRINLVGITDETAEQVRDHLAKYPARYAMAIDRISRTTYAVQSLPMIVVLNAEHRVVAVLLGARQLPDLDAKLQNLVGAPNQGPEQPPE